MRWGDLWGWRCSRLNIKNLFSHQQSIGKRENRFPLFFNLLPQTITSSGNNGNTGNTGDSPDKSTSWFCELLKGKNLDGIYSNLENGFPPPTKLARCCTISREAASCMLSACFTGEIMYLILLMVGCFSEILETVLFYLSARITA